MNNRLPTGETPETMRDCRRVLATHPYFTPGRGRTPIVANRIQPSGDPDALLRLIESPDWPDLLDEAVAEASAILPDGYSMVIEGDSGHLGLHRSRKEVIECAGFPTTRLLSPVSPLDAARGDDDMLRKDAQAVSAFDAACNALRDWIARKACLADAGMPCAA